MLHEKCLEFKGQPKKKTFLFEKLDDGNNVVFQHPVS